MECSGFYPPRSEAFPAGLRVLVVDDDPTWLKILEKMLKKCSYEVTTCGLAREALDLLRERKDGFDIVISDVNMPDMDGFKLLERVGLELDLPVIMMSVDGETSRVMKGVQHGACDYLLKPIRMKELKNIWQHVLRKRIHEVKETDSNGLDEIQMMSGNPSEYANDYYSFSMGDICSSKKRKKDAESKHDDKEYSDTSSIKKPRVVWTVDLHQKFVKAVNHIGFDKVGPKKILDLMGVPWLTRENVASHLQKYRLYLSRLQKDGKIEDTSFLGVMGAEVPPREVGEKVLLQNPINAQQNDVRNANCGTSGNKSQMPSSDVTPADSVPSQYLWTAEYPQIQHKQDSKSRFNHLPPKAQQHEQVNTVPASSYFSFRHENRKEDNLADLQVQEIREAPQQFGRTPSPTWSIKYGTSSAGSFLLDEQFDMRSIGVPSGSALSSNVIQGVHNVGESFEGIDPELLAAPLYESLKFDYEYSFDTMEYPVLDQSLFIV